MPVIANCSGLQLGGTAPAIVTNISNTEILVYNERLGIFISSPGALQCGSAGGGGDVVVSNTGTGTAIITPGTSSNLTFRTIAGGPNVTVTTDGNTLTITSAQNVQTAGTGDSIVKSAGQVLTLKSFAAGINTTIADNGNEISINSKQEILNTGLGSQIGSYNGSVLNLKTLINGANTTILDNGTTLQVNSTQAITNLGTGTAIGDISGTVLELKSIKAGTGVNVQTNGNEIVISAQNAGIQTINNIGIGKFLVVSNMNETDVKSIASGSNCNVIDDGQTLTINALQVINNTGPGIELATTVGSVINFKTLVSGSNTTVVQGADHVTFNSMQAVQNLGTGYELVSPNGTVLDFKTIRSGSGIQIVDTGSELQLSVNTGILQAPGALVLNVMTDLNNVISPNVGQMALVRDSGQGEWAFFIFTGNQWLSLSNYDSNATDANSFIVDITPSSPASILAGRVSAGSVITSIAVQVSVTFNGTPTLDIGILTNHSLLMQDALIDLATGGEYMYEPNEDMVGPGETEIYVFFNANGASSGKARVIVNYQ